MIILKPGGHVAGKVTFALNICGKVARLNIELPHVLTANVKQTTAMKFIGSPARAISGIVRYPVEKTIAFGGVATGNMNAKEHATVADIIRYNG